MPQSGSGRFRATMEMLFQRGGADVILKHASNLVMSTFIVAAGVHAVSRAETMQLWGVLHPRVVGYTVASFGVALFVLNLLDGLHRLARARRARLFQALFIIAYLFLTLRAAQLITSLRATSLSGASTRATTP